jgi:hypothetical protein
MKTCEGCKHWGTKRMYLGIRPYCNFWRRIWRDWCANFEGGKR